MDLIFRSEVMSSILPELNVRCLYKKGGVYVAIGFGYDFSRDGHETKVFLEKQTEFNVPFENSIQIRREGFLPLLFYFFLYFSVNFARYIDLNGNMDIKRLDEIGILIGIVVAFWAFVSWIFNNSTNTCGGIKDVFFWKASFEKVSQLRKHFGISRENACKAIYTSRFLTSLVGQGYSCYFPPDKFIGPLEVDEIARFDEVIGKRSLARKNKLIYQDKNGLRIVDMKLINSIAHIEVEYDERSNKLKLRTSLTNVEEKAYVESLLSRGNIILEEEFQAGFLIGCKS